MGERPSFLGVLGIAAIGVGIFCLTGGIRKNERPKIRPAVVAGLLTGGSIATYTLWDKYAVSTVDVSPVLLDLLGNPIQALLLTTIVWHQRTDISRYWATNRLELFGVHNSEPDLIYIGVGRDDYGTGQPNRSYARN